MNEQTLEQVLEANIVKTEYLTSKNKKIQGSGILAGSAEKSIYLITARHCLFSDDDSSDDSFNAERLQLFKLSAGDLVGISWKLKESGKRIFDEAQDLVILEITTNETLFPLELMQPRTQKQVEMIGFPEILQEKGNDFKRYSLPLTVHSTILPKGEVNLQFTQSVDVNVSNRLKDAIEGYSGSGLFCREKDKVYLCGMVFRLPTPKTTLFGITAFDAAKLNQYLPELDICNDQVNDLESFEKYYPKIAGSEVWKAWKEKYADRVYKNTELQAAVCSVSAFGLENASERCPYFAAFPTDYVSHVAEMMKWGWDIGSDWFKGLNEKEAGIFLMALCCHELGAAEVNEYRKETHKSGKMTDMWTNREACFKNAAEKLAWPATLSSKMKNSLQYLCSEKKPEEKCRPNNIAISSLQKLYEMRTLLHLTEILSFDGDCIPDGIAESMGRIQNQGFPWKEHCSEIEMELTSKNNEVLDTTQDTIQFTVTSDSMQTDHELRVYMDWVKKELQLANQELTSHYPNSSLKLNYPVEIEITADGYESGEFHITMDQDRIVELLVGNDLYPDKSVFIRELLQNAIDAVRTRAAFTPDNKFPLSDGRVIIRSWKDTEGYTWFSIEDNGIGMDESIIKNYFLKVGRSYYSSKQFEEDKAKAKAVNYHPISRFGIGILSCFMCGQKDTILKVSTRRYTGDHTDAIRMDIFGLHGYYNLVKEDTQRGNADTSRMPGPVSDSEGFRGEMEYGTTISVRFRMSELGAFTSIKEILDKYVYYPDVKVEYYEGAAEQPEVYTTSQELMALAHALNPEGKENKPRQLTFTEVMDGEKSETLKQHRIPLPDEFWESLKCRNPEIYWNEDEKPALIFTCQPLDWLIDDSGDDPDIQGCAFFMDLVGDFFLPISTHPELRKEFPYININAVPLHIDIYVDGQFSSYETDNIVIELSNKIIERSTNKKRIYALLSSKLDSVGSILEREEEYLSGKYYGRDFIRYETDDELKKRICDSLDGYDADDRLISRISGSHGIPEILKILHQEREDLKYRVDYEKKIDRYLGKIEIGISRKNFYSAVYDYIENNYETFRHINLPFDRLFHDNSKNRWVISFNGVTAGTRPLWKKGSNLISLSLLLKNEMRPEVDLARDSIRRFSPGAMIRLSIIQDRIIDHYVGYQYGEETLIIPREYKLFSQAEWLHVLETDPLLLRNIYISGVTLADLKSELESKSQMEVCVGNPDLVAITYAYCRTLGKLAVGKADKQMRNEILLLKGPQNQKLSGFPPTLFFEFSEESELFVYRDYDNKFFINIRHPFSQWLIAHQAIFQDVLPVPYKELISILLFTHECSILVSKVNDMLDRLRISYKELLEIPDDLHISEEEVSVSI